MRRVLRHRGRDWELTLTPTPTTMGDMYVTVTKHNYLPSENTATVTIGTGQLAIGKISGGMMKVSAALLNAGNMSTTHIQWSIALQGGLLLTGTKTRGTVASLVAGTNTAVEFYPILGFGPVNITVTAKADGITQITKTGNGFVFLFWVHAS